MVWTSDWRNGLLDLFEDLNHSFTAGTGCEINHEKARACMNETYVYHHFSHENIWWKLRKKVASQNTEIFVYIIYNSHNRSSANDTDCTKLNKKASFAAEWRKVFQCLSRRHQILAETIKWTLFLPYRLWSFLNVQPRFLLEQANDIKL